MLVKEPNFSYNSFLNIGHIIELWKSMQFLRKIKSEKLGVDTILIDLQINQSTAIIPTSTYINNIETNIERLALGTKAEKDIKTKIWQGENFDNPRLNYKDANRWFESINLIWGSM